MSACRVFPWAWVVAFSCIAQVVLASEATVTLASPSKSAEAAASPISVESETKKNSAAEVSAQAQNNQVKKTKVSTAVSFEDLLVQGKYHFSDEAITTVEEDKVLDALLGIRKDFKDRIKRSASRR